MKTAQARADEIERMVKLEIEDEIQREVQRQVQIELLRKQHRAARRSKCRHHLDFHGLAIPSSTSGREY